MAGFDHRLSILVPASRQVQANTRAAEVDAVGGNRTFSMLGLVPTGSPPGTTPTHWATGWQVTAEQRTALRTRLDTTTLREAGVRWIVDSPRSLLEDAALVGLEPARTEGP